MNELLTGTYYGLADSMYRSAPGVSQSMLKPLDQSPAHFQAALEESQNITPAKLTGLIVHHLALTSELPKFWKVKPDDYDGRSKDGKAWMAAWKDEWQAIYGTELKDKSSDYAITGESFRACQRCAEEIQTNPASARLLTNCKTEVSVFSTYQAANGDPVRKKGRKDIVSAQGLNYIADIKTSDDVRESSFQRDAYFYAYHRQAAYYIDLWNEQNPNDPKSHFVIIAVEKEPPFALNVFDYSPAAIAQGRAEYIRLLDLYAQCDRTGDWPGYSDEVKVLDLPKYAQVV